MSLDIVVFRHLQFLEPQPTEKEMADIFFRAASARALSADAVRNPGLSAEIADLMEPPALPDDAREERSQGYTYVVRHPNFPEHADGLREGCYSGTREMEFQAGTYSSYSEWRAHLCRMAHGVEPDVMWERPDEWKGKPFYKLVNFADDDGTIGPWTSAKLHRDFVAWQDKAREQDGKVEGFSDLYRKWTEAFRLASMEGVVRFL